MKFLWAVPALLIFIPEGVHATKSSEWNIGVAGGINYYQPALGGAQLEGTSTSGVPVFMMNVFAERSTELGFLVDFGAFYENRKYNVSPAEVSQNYTSVGASFQIGFDLGPFSLKAGAFVASILSKLETTGTAKGDTTYLPNESRYDKIDYGYIGSFKFYLLRYQSFSMPIEFRYLYGNKDLITSPNLTSFSTSYQALLGLQFPY